MNPQLQQFFSDLDAVAGKMDRALAKAEEYVPSGRTDLMVIHVKTAHDLVAQYGLLLRDAATWDSGGQKGEIAGSYGRAMEGNAEPAAPALRPGQQVADVSTTLPDDQGAFDGKVNPTLLTLRNWGYYARQNLGAKSGHIFDRPFTIGNPETGVTYDEGTLVASYQNADPIVRDAQGNAVADLSQWG